MPKTLSEIPSNNQGKNNSINETRPHNSLPNVSAPLNNNVNHASLNGRLVKNRTRRDLVLPLLSGLLLGVFEHFYEGDGYYKSMKVGLQQVFSVLIAEFAIGFLPASSVSVAFIEEYSVDIAASSIFGLLEWYFYKEKGFKQFSMNALFSFFALQLAKYVEKPLTPYLPSLITNFKL